MKKALIPWGGWPGHEPELCAHIVEIMLHEQGFEVQVEAYESALDKSGQPSGTQNTFLKHDLTALDLVVPIITQSVISKDAVAALTSAVEGGLGIAGFHGGMCDAFRDSVPYQFMTGGQWVAHPGNVIGYRVHITRTDDPVMQDLGDFDYRSEQYFMHVDPSIEVLATTTFSGAHAAWTKGVTMPVVWKHRYGAGRVFYSALGHVSSEFQVPQMRSILARGMAWAAR